MKRTRNAALLRPFCYVIMPASERKGNRDSGGRRLRDFDFKPTSAPSVAFGASSLPEGAFSK